MKNLVKLSAVTWLFALTLALFPASVWGQAGPMLKNLKLRSLTWLFAVTLALYPASVWGQFVYVSDNNSTFDGNGVSMYDAATYGTLTGPTNYVTGGTGSVGSAVALQEVVINYKNTDPVCLFVADPGAGTGYPNGDIASFELPRIHGGIPGPATQYAPFSTSGPNALVALAVDRRGPTHNYLYASFSAEGMIEVFDVTLSNCALTYKGEIAAVGLNGGAVKSMAVTHAGQEVLVVSYGDGSIQGFEINPPFGLLTATPAILSWGYTYQGGEPKFVDITENGLWAVFGDRPSSSYCSGTRSAEVEVASIWQTGGSGVWGSLISTPFNDYGGPCGDNATTFGVALGSANIWLSPDATHNEYDLYISSALSGMVTTAYVNQTSGVVTKFLHACTAGHLNQTTLLGGSWTYNLGLHTVYAKGTGEELAVAEYGSASEVALLNIDNWGCTEEVLGSPYTDPYSNNGLVSIDIFPSRPY